MTVTARPPAEGGQHRRERYSGRHYRPAERPGRARGLVVAGAVLLAGVGAGTAWVLGGASPSPGPDVTAGSPPARDSSPPARPSPEPVRSSAFPTPAPTASSTTPPSAAPPPAPAAPRLEDRLLTPPAGFQRVPDSEAGTGSLDVAGAVAADGPGGLTAEEFRELGLRAAHSREWRSGEGALVVLAYEFADPAGATAFVTRSSDPASLRAGAAPLPVPGPPGLQAFRMQVDGQPLQVALFTVDERAYAVGVRGALADDPDGERLREAVAAQAQGG